MINNHNPPITDKQTMMDVAREGNRQQNRHFYGRGGGGERRRGEGGGGEGGEEDKGDEQNTGFSGFNGDFSPRLNKKGIGRLNFR